MGCRAELRGHVFFATFEIPNNDSSPSHGRQIAAAGTERRVGDRGVSNDPRVQQRALPQGLQMRTMPSPRKREHARAVGAERDATERATAPSAEFFNDPAIAYPPHRYVATTFGDREEHAIRAKRRRRTRRPEIEGSGGGSCIGQTAVPGDPATASSWLSGLKLKRVAPRPPPKARSIPSGPSDPRCGLFGCCRRRPQAAVRAKGNIPLSPSGSGGEPRAAGRPQLTANKRRLPSPAP